jgi:hypothetical protein
MNDDQTEQLKREEELGNQGRLVLNNIAYQQAFQIRKAEVFMSFTDSKEGETKKRDEAWRTMQNLIALEEYFKEVLDTGKMARDQLKSYT